MVIIRNLNLISVQSWTYLEYPSKSKEIDALKKTVQRLQVILKWTSFISAKYMLLILFNQTRKLDIFPPQFINIYFLLFDLVI